jgi:hypothetical protein
MRPVPEMGICYAYTPARPNLYTLNATAWLLATLCDGKSGRSLIGAYASAFGRPLSRDQAVIDVRNTIEFLEDKGIVVSNDRKRAGPSLTTK